MPESIYLIEKYIEDNLDSYDHLNHRLSDVAYECLKDAILTQDVRSGDPVAEKQLSIAFNFSRTPIRSAIQKLAQEGLLQIIPGRAVFIASRSPKQVLDALKVRILLEPETCRLATEAMSGEQRKLLEELTNRLEEAVVAKDRSAWARTDLQWHELICKACPNELLGQLVLQAFHHMRIQGVISHISYESLNPGTREHREIADAILAGDGDRSVDLMRLHLQSARERMFLSER